MIVCDFCKKPSDNIQSIVLYTKRIDYCENCKNKARNIKRSIKNSIKFYEAEADKKIREAENNILRRDK